MAEPRSRSARTTAHCPICGRLYPISDIQQHADECASKHFGPGEAARPAKPIANQPKAKSAKPKALTKKRPVEEDGDVPSAPPAESGSSHIDNGPGSRRPNRKFGPKAGAGGARPRARDDGSGEREAAKVDSDSEYVEIEGITIKCTHLEPSMPLWSVLRTAAPPRMLAPRSPPTSSAAPARQVARSAWQAAPLARPHGSVPPTEPSQRPSLPSHAPKRPLDEPPRPAGVAGAHQPEAGAAAASEPAGAQPPVRAGAEPPAARAPPVAPARYEWPDRRVRAGAEPPAAPARYEWPDRWVRAGAEPPAAPARYEWPDGGLELADELQTSAAFGAAESYLSAVKRALASMPERLSSFLSVLADFVTGGVDTLAVMERVAAALQGEDALLTGFNQFLPSAYRLRTVRAPPAAATAAVAPRLARYRASFVLDQLCARLASHPEVLAPVLAALDCLPADAELPAVDSLEALVQAGARGAIHGMSREQIARIREASAQIEALASSLPRDARDLLRDFMGYLPAGMQHATAEPALGHALYVVQSSCRA